MKLGRQTQSVSSFCPKDKHESALLSNRVRNLRRGQTLGTTQDQIQRAGRQSRGHQASSQSGLGAGCKLAPAAKSCAGWVHVRRCAYKHSPLVLCCEGFLHLVSLKLRDKAQRNEVQCRVSVSGRSVSVFQSPFSLPCRTLSCRTARGRALKPPCHC